MLTSVSAFSPMLSGCASSFHPGSKADTFESEGKIIEQHHSSRVSMPVFNAHSLPWLPLTIRRDSQILSSTNMDFRPARVAPGWARTDIRKLPFLLARPTKRLFSHIWLCSVYFHQESVCNPWNTPMVSWHPLLPNEERPFEIAKVPGRCEFQQMHSNKGTFSIIAYYMLRLKPRIQSKIVFFFN